VGATPTVKKSSQKTAMPTAVAISNDAIIATSLMRQLPLRHCVLGPAHIYERTWDGRADPNLTCRVHKCVVHSNHMTSVSISRALWLRTWRSTVFIHLRRSGNRALVRLTYARRSKGAFRFLRRQ
jgi:hypothetical protein